MDNIEFIKILKESPSIAMDYLYKHHYGVICGVVFMIIKNKQAAEDVVQELFLYIWRKRDTIEINISLPAYLRQAARNRSLNYLRAQRVIFEEEEVLLSIPSTDQNEEQYRQAHELEMEIEHQILALPEKCAIVFALSRFENMTYSEIATELNISIKTVEHQISKALRVLRNNIYNHHNVR